MFNRRGAGLAVAIGGVLLLGAMTTAGAASIEYSLDCVYNPDPTCTPGGPFGNLTIADNGGDPNLVDVTINLEGSANKILHIALNYDDSLFSNTTAFTVTGGVTTLDVDENAVQPQGAGCGGNCDFDLRFPDTGNVNAVDTVTFTIALASTDLNPSHFNFTNPAGLFAAVHIGNINCPVEGCQPGVEGEESVTAGAHPVAVVPEPGTLLLLGSGLAAVGAFGRRRRRHAEQSEGA